MPALTPTISKRGYSARWKKRTAKLPAVSDGDTWNTGLRKVFEESIKLTFNDDTAVAADSIAVASVSGGTITFQVAGTARKVNVECEGY